MNWYSIGTTSHLGYPQPENTYAERTYHPETLCLECDIGKIQANPFRMRGEPKATRSAFLQLNWVHDELFVRKGMEDLFAREEITGISFLPVLKNSTGMPLESVSQVVIGNILPPGLMNPDLEPVTCKEKNEDFRVEYNRGSRGNRIPKFCGKVKYPLPDEMVYAARTFEEALDFNKTFEWFGGGYAAFQGIIVSEKVFLLIGKHKLRGLYFDKIRIG